jgi:DNA-binding beta-propeller fold protein YncE
MIGRRNRLRATLSLTLTTIVVVVLVMLGLGVVPALAARGHVFTGSFASPGSGPGQLGEPSGVAVNETTGDVYVVDKANNRVEIFNHDGSKFEGEFNGSGLGLGIMGSGQLLNEGKAAGTGGLPEEIPSGRFNGPEEIAIDNDPSSPSFGDVYVADAETQAIVHNTQTRNPVVDKFSATGEYIGQITRNPNGEEFSGEGFQQLFGVAVDPRGEVWVEEQQYGGGLGSEFVRRAANYSNAVENVWIGSRDTEYFNVPIVSALAEPGFAVDSNDDLYVHQGFAESPGYEQNGHVVIDVTSEFSAGGDLISPVVDIEVPTGLAAELSSNDVYIDHGSSVHRWDASGRSLESLSVRGGHGSGVAVDSATMTVYVADSAAGIVDVYGPEPPGVPTVPAGSESVKDVTATSVTFSGEVNPRSEPFEEATSYSFEYGPCDTPTSCKSSPFVDSVPVPAGVLAANYEPDLVSAHLQDLVAHTTYHMRLVAHNSRPGVAEGEELVFVTQAAGAFALSDGRVWEMVSPANKYGALIQAALGVSQASVSGSAITYLANAPIEAQPPGSSGSQVQALAGRGGTGWRSIDINAPHETAPGVVQNEYPFFSGDLRFGMLQPSGAFVASMSPEASEQTPFVRTNFVSGDPANLCTSSCFTPLVSGAPGFENVPAGTAFGGNKETGGECTAGGCGPAFVGASRDGSHIVLQYKWAPLVEGAPPSSLYVWNGGRLSVLSILPDESMAGATLGSPSGVVGIVRNAVSASGSRAVWSSGPHLYLRDVVRGETVQLDAVQGGSGAGALAPPVFQAAASDGSRVFFTDTQRLTVDGTGPEDLYECEIVEEAGELKCKLTDLTERSSTEPSQVMGLIPGVSEDGSYAYFVANGGLSGVFANGRGETPVAGQPNLYVRHAGVTRLVAVLSFGDARDWATSTTDLTARVSPDGRWFSFVSDRPLTGYDNRDAVSGRRDSEVFLYHAGGIGGDSLVCASCNPTGGRPYGAENDRALEGLGPGSLSVASIPTAGSLPGWTSPFYQSRYLSNSGRLFFDSVDGLVPQDTNSAEDAYQFEPTGVGDCTGTSVSFVVVSDGCVSLISSGTSKEGSAFLDASESGGDVFFLTTAQLSPLDIDSAIDIYDAH